MTTNLASYIALPSEKPQINEKIQFYFTFLISMSLMGTGMNHGWSAVSLPLLTKNDTSNDAILYGHKDAASWFVSIMAICILVGCPLNVYIMRTGRKKPIILYGYLCTIGWLIVGTSYGFVQILIGRFIAGLGAGMLLPPSVMYLSEMATLRYRTTLLGFVGLSGTAGHLLVYCLGYFVKNWRYQAAVSLTFPLFSATSLLFLLPESPVWLINKNQPLLAKKALMRLRGLKIETSALTDEFNQLVKDSEQSKKTANEGILVGDASTMKNRIRALWWICKLPEVWKPFAIISFMIVLQQFCAIPVILAYAVDFLEHCGLSSDPFLLTIIVGLTKILGSIILLFLNRRLNNRTIYLSTCAIMALSFGLLGVYLQFIKQHDENHRYQVIAIISFFVYLVAGSIGIFGLTWPLVGEFYPPEYAHIMIPVTYMTSVPSVFTALYIYPPLVTTFGIIPVIYFYAIVGVISIIFIAIVVPESRRVPRHVIRAKFQNKKDCTNISV